MPDYLLQKVDEMQESRPYPLHGVSHTGGSGGDEMSQEKPNSVMPMVGVPSVDDARKFYVEKLGFEQQMGVLGKDGKLDFVNVVRNGASIMFSRAAGEPSAKPAAR